MGEAVVAYLKVRFRYMLRQKERHISQHRGLNLGPAEQEAEMIPNGLLTQHFG
jgi:hypothetical protein